MPKSHAVAIRDEASRTRQLILRVTVALMAEIGIDRVRTAPQQGSDGQPWGRLRGRRPNDVW